nr:MAG TPA: hypothetical protein [Caudoviricetes sp.]
MKIFRCNQNQRNVFYKNLWKGVKWENDRL